MPPTWSDYRTVIGRNGFKRERVKKHETWIQRDAQGRIRRSTRASKGGGEIGDKALFSSLLRQCGKTKKHFNEVLQGKPKPKPQPKPKKKSAPKRTGGGSKGGKKKPGGR